MSGGVVLHVGSNDGRAHPCDRDVVTPVIEDEIQCRDLKGHDECLIDEEIEADHEALLGRTIMPVVRTLKSGVVQVGEEKSSVHPVM